MENPDSPQPTQNQANTVGPNISQQVTAQADLNTPNILTTPPETPNNKTALNKIKKSIGIPLIITNIASAIYLLRYFIIKIPRVSINFPEDPTQQYIRIGLIILLAVVGVSFFLGLSYGIWKKNRWVYLYFVLSIPGGVGKFFYKYLLSLELTFSDYIGVVGGLLSFLLLIDFRETWKKGGKLNTPKKLAVIGLVLAIILSGAYSFISESAPQYEETRINTKGNSYPDAFTISFKATCNLGEKHCNCVLEYLENNYSYSDFEKDSKDDDWRLIEANNYCKP